MAAVVTNSLEREILRQTYNFPRLCTKSKPKLSGSWQSVFLRVSQFYRDEARGRAAVPHAVSIFSFLQKKFGFLST